MKIFALDTATEACSVALWLDGVIVERFEVAGRDHTQRLPAMAHALMAEAGLAWSQLDGLVCGIGPGSFAGVRIGVAYTQGLALAHGQPVVGVSSLAMLAGGAGGPGRVLAAIDARMDEVYFAAFQRDVEGGLRIESKAQVCRPEAVPACRSRICASTPSGPPPPRKASTCPQWATWWPARQWSTGRCNAPQSASLPSRRWLMWL